MALAPPLWCAPPSSPRLQSSFFWLGSPSSLAAWVPWQQSGERAEVAVSVQSNPQISKPNRRSRYGQPLLTFSPEDEDESLLAFDADSQDVESGWEDSQISELAENVQRGGLRKVNKVGKASLKSTGKPVSSLNAEQNQGPGIIRKADSEELKPQYPLGHAPKVNLRGSLTLDKRQGTLTRKQWEEQVYRMVRQPKYQNATTFRLTAPQKEGQRTTKPSSSSMRRMPRKPFSYLRVPLNERDSSKIEDSRLESLRSQLSIDDKYMPLVEYLVSLGLGDEDLQRIAERNRACLQLRVDAVKGRVQFLGSLGIKSKFLSKLIVKHPQILEYRVDSMVKPKIEYLRSLGIPEVTVGKMIRVRPSILECSLKNSLKPRVDFLRKVVGISEFDISKVVTRSPQVLTQSIEESLEPQVDFFLQEMKVTKVTLAKIVTKHPQLLHYSVEEGIRPRIEFLRSIGMSEEDVLKVLTRMTQVFSLSVENSLKPKYEYLVGELKGGVQTVVSFPAYFSLSLDQRIKPRHRFLITLQRLPKGPFPMKCLAVTDDYYCKHWAKASLEDYYSFRDALVLRNFAQKFEKKNTVQM